MLAWLRRLIHRLAVRADQWSGEPFPRLVVHFLRRIVHGGGDSASEAVDLGAGPLLGILAAPGAFQCMLMLEKYSSLLKWFKGQANEDVLTTSLPDKYLFIAISMGLTGIVTVLKWDRILPDGQDYVNLAPLPVRPRTVLAANVTAIGIAAAVVALTVNAASLLLFPLFVSDSAPPGSIPEARFLAVHALCVLLGSLFAFVSVLGVMGSVAAVVPRRTFEGWAAGGRSILLVSFVILTLGAFNAGSLIAAVKSPDAAGLRWLPSLWYLGLYQSLQDRGPAALVRLAPLAWAGLGAMLALAGVSYALSYGHRFRAVPETRTRTSAQPFTSLLLAVLCRLVVVRSAFTRAICLFAFRGLLRNDAQRLALFVPLGLGWFLAAQLCTVGAGLAAASTARHAASLYLAPFIPACLLILGLRIAFDVPAAVQASWIFRSVLDPRCHSARTAVRQVAGSLTFLLVVVPAGVLWFNAFGVRLAILHSSCLFVLSALLIELTLSQYHRIPFTCIFPPFRQSLPMTCVLYFLGAIVFVWAGGALQAWLVAAPGGVLIVAAAPITLWCWNETQFRNALKAGDPRVHLSFAHHDDATLALLAITDSVRAQAGRDGNG